MLATAGAVNSSVVVKDGEPAADKADVAVPPDPPS